MAKSPNNTVGARRSSRMSNVCNEKKSEFLTSFVNNQIVFDPETATNKQANLFEIIR